MPNERSAQFDNSLLCRQTENEATFVPHDVSAAVSMSKYYASRMSAQSINNRSQFCLFSSCKIQLERTQAEKELRNSLTHTLAGVYHCNANEGSAHRTLSLCLFPSQCVPLWCCIKQGEAAAATATATATRTIWCRGKCLAHVLRKRITAWEGEQQEGDWGKKRLQLSFCQSVRQSVSERMELRSQQQQQSFEYE